MTLLGYPLHELKAIHVKEFLDGAEAEPLLWEAKGTKLDKHEIRRQVCGFANGLQAAYLILGATYINEEWKLEPMDFPEEPPAWVSSVIGDVLRPVPPLDVATIGLQGGGQIAVVEVPPIAIAPCICSGTVFERVSGRTIPVKDPARLAELYQRGRNARENAAASARNASIAVIQDPDGPGAGSGWPRISLALSATGHPADISSRLFSESFEAAMIEVIERELVPLTPGAPPAYGPKLSTGFEQSNRSVDCEDRLGHGKPTYWHVRVIWDGTVVVCGAWDIDSVAALHLSSELINGAWTTASRVLEKLGGYGPHHMELQIQGEDALIGGPKGNPMPRIQIGRGPVESPPDEAQFSSVERELRRATGEVVYELPRESADSEHN